MHTEPPPKKVLEDWLEEFYSEIDDYGHTLLEQKAASDQTIVDGLRPYFESAHTDARAVFHDFSGFSLHPDAGVSGCDACYPNCLPPISRRGLFGEVVSGMLTEAFPFIGGHEWVVPVFLFRFHEDACQYIYTLSRDSSRKREVYGRRGDDFIGLAVSNEGKVTRFIAGEAKWRQTWNASTLDAVMLGEKIDDPNDKGKKIHNGKGVWFEINRALIVPIGLRQLQKILVEHAADEFGDVILSLDSILQLDSPQAVERTDLILLAGGGAARRQKTHSLIPWESAPPEYTAGRNLQVVELILDDGDTLVDALYDCLWTQAP